MGDDRQGLSSNHDQVWEGLLHLRPTPSYPDWRRGTTSPDWTKNCQDTPKLKRPFLLTGDKAEVQNIVLAAQFKNVADQRPNQKPSIGRTPQYNWFIEQNS